MICAVYHNVSLFDGFLQNRGRRSPLAYPIKGSAVGSLVIAKDIGDTDYVPLNGSDPSRETQPIYCGCPVKGMPTDIKLNLDLNSSRERSQSL